MITRIRLGYLCIAACLGAGAVAADDVLRADTTIGMELHGLTVVSGLVNYQVFQRDNQDVASFVVTGRAFPYDTYRVRWRVRQRNRTLEQLSWNDATMREGGHWRAQIDGLPVGGPYRVQVQLMNAAGQLVSQIERHHILVGDLWFLGGQSNMDGCGKLDDREQPSEMVNAYTLANEWMVAEDPLAIAAEGIYKIYRTSYAGPTRRKPVAYRSRDDIQTGYGAGLGVPFAKEVYRVTGVPIGLIVGSLGGSSMMFWDPDKQHLGEDSLYWCALERIRSLGGSITGVLWWQGESDIYAPVEYENKFRVFITTLRKDLAREDLPFYAVQLCHGSPGLPIAHVRGWCRLQDTQRRLMEELDHSGIVSTMDLQLQDAHLTTASYKVVGRRLAKLALGDAYGKSQYQPGPHLDKISYFSSLHGDGIKLSFRGVNGRLKAAVRVSGFTLRREDQTNDRLTIIRQELDPDDPNGVLLHLVFKLAEKQPLYLWYGWGANPFCHVTDEENMALPMFGPVALPSRK